ncbi:MAG: ASCH domain-containing protein [Propionibacteriales bacterium]|nr:ASCH domain-containing protein [Propionibacteriales bacterium]
MAPPLPVAEFGYPGPVRDRLVAAILRGEKTSTTSLVEEYTRTGEPLPEVGQRTALADSAGGIVAVIETTGVRTLPLSEVELDHVLAEGEGFSDVPSWRAAHERFWSSAEAVAERGVIEVGDQTPVVLEAFRLVT